MKPNFFKKNQQINKLLAKLIEKQREETQITNI